jgi:hypothetical protein
MPCCLLCGFYLLGSFLLFIVLAFCLLACAFVGARGYEAEGRLEVKKQ